MACELVETTLINSGTAHQAPATDKEAHQTPNLMCEKTTINHQFRNSCVSFLFRLFMVICGMVHYCFTNVFIIKHWGSTIKNGDLMEIESLHLETCTWPQVAPVPSSSFCFKECDHVTCECGHEFCWDCGIDRRIPLAHDNRRLNCERLSRRKTEKLNVIELATLLIFFSILQYFIDLHRSS